MIDGGPFELPAAVERGARADAVLLVHGFASSPAEMRPVAERLAAEGLHAFAPLLPGHESAEALEGTPWSAWADAVAAHVERLRRQHGRVFAVGFSAGGALLLRHAALHDGALAGLASLAAPVELTGLGRLHPVVSRMGLGKVVRYWPKPLRDIRDAEARRGYPSLPRLPLRAVGQLAELLADLRERLPAVRVPLLVAHSRRDHTVSPRAAHEILARVGSEIRESLILRESFHVITVDRERAQVCDAVSTFFARLRG